MVFFTCNACGESLKKAQVDKHVNMCRGCEILSCIDCGKDFWGNDYKNHIKCISEDQKYGGKGFEAKSKKGDVKQQQWIQRIQEAMNKPGINAQLKGVLQQVSSYDNVPRKKAKFQNWMKNSLKIYHCTMHDQVWEIFSAATSNTSSEEADEKKPVADIVANGTQPPSQNGTTAELETEKKKLNKRERKEARQKKSGKKEKKSPEGGSVEEEDAHPVEQKDKKRKRSSEEAEQNGSHAAVTTKKCKKSKKDHSKDDQSVEEEEIAEEEGDEEGKSRTKGKFNWKGTIKAVLRQSPEEGIAVKKLKKKVMSAYYSFSAEGNFKSEEELLAIYNKKLKGNPKFRVLKDKVRLIK
ncbi:hypothetical protein DPEC_G00196820 [Dallia pectoralis]|uniref:Uncharacterized protein n=1 Tax=Dallia pectoralis TaxID=75939 RepID=A0ACC2G809_DALPE|nr:hypothetical protein DPEC_G00196820 [Dallia pectoralis]